MQNKNDGRTAEHDMARVGVERDNLTFLVVASHVALHRLALVLALDGCCSAVEDLFERLLLPLLLLLRHILAHADLNGVQNKRAMLETPCMIGDMCSTEPTPELGVLVQMRWKVIDGAAILFAVLESDGGNDWRAAIVLTSRNPSELGYSTMVAYKTGSERQNGSRSELSTKY